MKSSLNETQKTRIIADILEKLKHELNCEAAVVVGINSEEISEINQGEQIEMNSLGGGYGRALTMIHGIVGFVEKLDQEDQVHLIRDLFLNLKRHGADLASVIDELGVTEKSKKSKKVVN